MTKPTKTKTASPLPTPNDANGKRALDSDSQSSVPSSSAKKLRGDSNDKQKIHPFFTTWSKKPASITSTDSSNWTFSWKDEKSMLVGLFNNPTPRTKIAAFDLDSTLTRTKGKHVFPKDENDWQFLYPAVPSKLKELYYESGYGLVIFSNQSGLSKKPEKSAQFKGRVQGLARALGIPLFALAATAEDWYRKPCPGMWETFLTLCNTGVQVDLKECYFVGDAAGREAGWRAGAKKDFSDSDRKFAANIGIDFLTPEEYFLGDVAVPYPEPVFDPRKIPRNLPLFSPTNTPLVGQQTELIVCVGSPASGKSTFATKFLLSRGYTHINQDTLKTRDKCIAACEAALKSAKSCVIDNTNPEAKTRAFYIQLARKYNVPIRCFLFTASEYLCRHNNLYRNKVSSRERLPHIAFSGFAARFESPKLEEGFVEIKRINFVPTFDNDDQERLFNLWYF
ncbi:hypothetical protein HK102_002374 [Quaeritorhiza haematococci]|nr:hypothetical protein HK102_002374 [Quaeritorhiza haematococci]